MERVCNHSDRRKLSTYLHEGVVFQLKTLNGRLIKFILETKTCVMVLLEYNEGLFDLKWDDGCVIVREVCCILSI